MLNFTPMVVMPRCWDLGGYPEAVIGTLLGTSRSGAVGFFLAGRLARLDPKVGMTIGFVLQTVSGLT